MKRVRLYPAVAALAAFFVVAVTAGGADTFQVRLVSQTNSTITLGWDAQPGYGYLFTAAGVLVSRTNDPSRTSVKFSKVTPASYDVDVITKGANGHYPSVTPPPPAAACADGLDNDGDGKVDLADPGCSSSTDTDETDPVTPPPVGACDTTTPNVPGGPDGNGGCFPGLANTGPNAAASTMASYTGSCTISVANTVIDSKVVNCRTIVVSASGFVLKNSYLNGGIVQSGSRPAFTVQDSLVDSGVQYPACSDGSCPAGKYACGDPNNQTTDCGITGANYTVLRTEVINSNRAAYCFTSCLVQDNYFHGTNLWPDKSNLAHASSMREEQNLTLRHNSLHCSYTGPFVNGEIGCSADLTGYPDFTAIKNNTVDGNLFVASIGSGFCAYGGNTQGKPFSSDPTNATNQKFTNNVFQRGSNNKCAAYGPVTDFSTTRSGNVWSGNVWSDGSPVAPG